MFNLGKWAKAPPNLCNRKFISFTRKSKLLFTLSIEKIGFRSLQTCESASYLWMAKLNSKEGRKILFKRIQSKFFGGRYSGYGANILAREFHF